MPTYRHKDTGKRFLFVHIPRNAGRFIENNLRNSFSLNGLPMKIIYKSSNNPYGGKK